MAAINFPDPNVQTSYTNPDTGISYEWSNGIWKAVRTAQTAPELFVDVDGDNLTGNLTLGTDKIVLNATEGSATFGGGNISFTSDGRSVFSSPNTTGTIFDAYFTSTSAGNFFRGYNNVTETCRIKADGSATFAAGAFQIDDAGVVQTNINTAGHVKLSSTANFVNPTINLNAIDGSATFGDFNTSSLTTHGVTIDQFANSHSGVRVQSTDAATTVGEFFAGYRGSNPVFQVTTGGSATFASEVVAGVRDSQGVFMTSGGALEGFVSGNRVYNLGSDGSATFAGDIVLGAGGTDMSQIYAAGSTALLHLSGGGSGSANIDLHGSTHSSDAKTITFDTDNVERMNIGSDGNIKIGTTSDGAGAGFVARLSVSGGDAGIFKTTGVGARSAFPLRAWHDADVGDNILVGFAIGSSYVGVGSITYDRGTNLTQFNTTSDSRLKTNITDASSALSDLSQVRVRSFDWIEDGHDRVKYGFVAQELNNIAPYAVSEGDHKDEVIQQWEVSNSSMVPLLTKALQEAIAKIETLEQRLSDAGIA